MSIGKKVKMYMDFTKFRLSALVIISALSGYLFVGGKDGLEITWLLVGGFLVTAASNGSNQIWERELDILMKRTEKRPLPMGTMGVKEALITVSAWAVFVGAFPGAIPPMLGAVAYTDEFGLIPGVLFFVQFVWQFPHFWAIAWVVYDDYQLGGFSLLPSKSGRSKSSAYQIAAYSLALIPFSLLPWVMGWTSYWTLIIACLCTAYFFFLSYRLLYTCETKDARKLMFASFIILPILQFLYVFDRIPEKILEDLGHLAS